MECPQRVWLLQEHMWNARVFLVRAACCCRLPRLVADAEEVGSGHNIGDKRDGDVLYSLPRAPSHCRTHQIRPQQSHFSTVMARRDETLQALR